MAKHEDEGEGHGEAPAGGGKKKLIIMGAAGLVVLLAAGGGAFVFIGGKKEEPPPVAEIENLPKQAAYYNMPELVINLNGPPGRSSFLKMTLTLELESSAEVLPVQAMMPRIVNGLQDYLRELRAEDLRGSASMYRLREEILARIQSVSAPAKVTDVLFSEVLVQ